MPYFHLKLIAPRTTFPFDASDVEKAAMQEHFAYWQARIQERTAIVVGPVFDQAGPYGMAVIEADDDAKAQSLADADPVISAGLGFAYSISTMPSILRA